MGLFQVPTTGPKKIRSPQRLSQTECHGQKVGSRGASWTDEAQCYKHCCTRPSSFVKIRRLTEDLRFDPTSPRRWSPKLKAIRKRGASTLQSEVSTANRSAEANRCGEQESGEWKHDHHCDSPNEHPLSDARSARGRLRSDHSR